MSNAIDAIVSELTANSAPTAIQAAPPLRRKQANLTLPSTPREPASETLSAEAMLVLTTTKLKPRRKRKAKDAMSTKLVTPSAPISADHYKNATQCRVVSGSDQASAEQNSMETTPGRTTIRATQNPLDNHIVEVGASVGDHGHGVDHSAVVPDAPSSESQRIGETQGTDALAGDDRAQLGSATRELESPVIAQIRQLWRMRVRWHKAEKSLTLQGKALCRAWFEGDKEIASKAFDGMLGGKTEDRTLMVAVAPFIAAIGQFSPDRLLLEKRLRKLSQTLPIWSWVRSVKGFGPLNLAAIVGECGDIGSFKSPSALWKRMGLAVMPDGRQRRVTDPKAAELHGYNPSRRAIAWNLGECLIKVGGDGPYVQVYRERKAMEVTRVATALHAHRRASRYMTKRVFLHLWQQWRKVQGAAQ